MDLNLFVIIAAALVDSINPCAFAVIIFLITYLSALGVKNKILKVGFAYIASVYVTYFLAGLGLITIVNISGISKLVYNIAAIIAILFGLINVKDYFWYGKGITLAIPASKKPLIKKYVQMASIPASLILGFLVALFELPCTGGVYLAILSILAKPEMQGVAMFYLAVYNLIFVLPLAIILLLFWKGVSSEKMEKWRTKERGKMKLVLGLVMITLGIWMIWG